MIDYRGDGTTINPRGDSLFNYRTRYFHRQQQDFHKWKQQGHTFHCFTQHDPRAVIDDWWAFDEVIPVARATQPRVTNQILEWAQPGEWLGIWDNDATLYWDRMWSQRLPPELEGVCVKAEDEGIGVWIPYNAQQKPYPPRIADDWLFEPTLAVKSTMHFLQVNDVRLDETLPALYDHDFGIQQMRRGVKCAQLQQAALNELVNGKSTIFAVNAHHPEWGQRELKKNQLKWDAQWSRQEIYHTAKQQIEAKWGVSLRELTHEHRTMWRD